MSNTEIVSGLVNYILVAILLLFSLGIVLSIFCKKFKLDDSKIKLYGLFLNMDTKSLVAISSLTINFTFLIWWTLNFCGINVIYIVFTLILLLISNIVLDDSKGVIFSVLSTIVSCSLIQVIYMLYVELTTNNPPYIVMAVEALLIIFAVLYYAWSFTRTINNIVVKNKHIKNKTKYKV